MTLPCGRCHVDAATTTLTLPLHRWRCYHHWDITTTILTLPPANYCCSYNHSLTPSPQKHHTIIDAAALQSLPMTALVTLFSWGNFTPISFWKTPNQTPVTGMVTWGAGRTLQCSVPYWGVVLCKYGDRSSCQVTEDPQWPGLIWGWNKVWGGIFLGKLKKGKGYIINTFDVFTTMCVLNYFVCCRWFVDSSMLADWCGHIYWYTIIPQWNIIIFAF